LLIHQACGSPRGVGPTFVMYGEEADLCLLVRRLGLCPTITPEATIVHYGGASERVRTDKSVRLLKSQGGTHRAVLFSPISSNRFVAAADVAVVCFAALSTIARRPGFTSYAESARTWSAVRRRGEWRSGF
jgi:hypothetical protein